MDNVGDGGIWHVIKTFWAWLPTITGSIGGFIGMIAATIQLYESRTFQHWKNNWLMKHRAHKLARLQKKAKITSAKIEALEKIRHARMEARVIVAQATEDAKTITEKTAVVGLIETPSSL
ncbi:MAG: hypothetical protein ACREGR_02180 [Minisyncoccia bacterium]